MNVVETAVIGSCLASEQALVYTLGTLRPDQFEDFVATQIFKVMKELRDENIPVDPVTLSETIPTVLLKKIGGRGVIMALAENVPTALHVEHYVALVQRDFFRRELVKAHQQALEKPDDQTLRDNIRKLWEEMTQTKSKLMDLDKDLIGYLERLEERQKSGADPGIYTGYPGLDTMTGGLRKGQLVTVAARTSRGKTTFLLCLADRLISRGRSVLFYSAEMGYDELVDRMLSARTKIPLSRIRGKMFPGDFPVISKECGNIHKRPLKVEDMGRLTIGNVRAVVEAVRPEILMVDYIQRFQVPAGANRAAFFSDVANELKSLAREKGMLVFATSQINRSVQEGTKEREPTLSDLKESGGIEEASDIVLMLHTTEKPEGPQQTFNFIFAKQRNGPLGRVQFNFFRHTVSFEELEDVEDDRGQNTLL